VTYEISTARERIDIERVHGWLLASYWAAGIPRDLLERAIAGSLCFRAYLCDVIVYEQFGFEVVPNGKHMEHQLRKGYTE
jgi:hypothetical protein